MSTPRPSAWVRTLVAAVSLLFVFLGFSLSGSFLLGAALVVAGLAGLARCAAWRASVLRDRERELRARGVPYLQGLASSQSSRGEQAFLATEELLAFETWQDVPYADVARASRLNPSSRLVRLDVRDSDVPVPRALELVFRSPEDARRFLGFAIAQGVAVEDSARSLR